MSAATVYTHGQLALVAHDEDGSITPLAVSAERALLERFAQSLDEDGGGGAALVFTDGIAVGERANYSISEVVSLGWATS